MDKVINTPSHTDGPRMWFPRLESAQDKCVLMGVPLLSGQEKPDVEDYCDLLAMRIQGLADALKPEEAMEIAEDSLMMGSQVRMGDPTELGIVIVESDPALDILIQEAVSELVDDAPGLPALEQTALQQQAKELTFSEFVNEF